MKALELATWKRTLSCEITIWEFEEIGAIQGVSNGDGLNSADEAE